MQKLGMERGEAIEHGMVTRAIEKAQRKVEGRNFDIRKQLLEYDNVANDQRTIVYRQRNELMASDDISDLLVDMRKEVVEQLVDTFIPPQSVPEQWDIEGLEQALQVEFASEQPVQAWLDADEKLYEEQIKERVLENLNQAYEEKSAAVGDKMRAFEKQITLQILDGLWKEHLATMDHLRQGIFLRSYGGKNPRQEYKREAFALFQDLMTNLQQEVTKVLSHVRIRQDDEADAIEKQRAAELAAQKLSLQHQQSSALSEPRAPSDAAQRATVPVGSNRVDPAPFVRELPKVGRNELCPCGSGRKYKACHGKIA
jgi:preprotein translocase subunit SecA